MLLLSGALLLLIAVAIVIFIVQDLRLYFEDRRTDEAQTAYLRSLQEQIEKLNRDLSEQGFDHYGGQRLKSDSKGATQNKLTNENETGDAYGTGRGSSPS